MKRIVTVGWVFCLIDFALSPSHVPTRSIFKGPTEAAWDPYLADTECWEEAAAMSWSLAWLRGCPAVTCHCLGIVSDLLMQASLLPLWDFPQGTEPLWGLRFLCKRKSCVRRMSKRGESFKIHTWVPFSKDSELAHLQLDLRLCTTLNLIMKMS